MNKIQIPERAQILFNHINLGERNQIPPLCSNISSLSRLSPKHKFLTLNFQPFCQNKVYDINKT